MAKKQTAEKVIEKLAKATKSAGHSQTGVGIILDRRQALPQPDFKYYRAAGNYPGISFFFVGHSYNVEHNCCDGQFLLKRKNAIKKLFKNAGKNQTVSVKNALEKPDFNAVLSRFERDWLGRLPESSLIGPAINEEGHEIAHSFTVWRPEQRKELTTQQGKNQGRVQGKSSTNRATNDVSKTGSKQKAGISANAKSKSLKTATPTVVASR